MSPISNRRRFLTSICSMAVALSAGCLTTDGERTSETTSTDPEQSATTPSCENGTIRISAEPTTPSQPDDLAPLEVEQLPEGEREIVYEAIRGDTVQRCHPGSDAIQSLVERSREHVTRQRDDPNIYAIDGDKWYTVRLFVLDEEVP